ncbi:MAG: NAD(P)H:quinone oxidoreductase [bacterium]|nr:NAD(P)H:quinone oxidoreductase [bacterium]
MLMNIAVIYYSASGTMHQLATAVADGARSEGADVRLLRVAELAPEEAIDRNPAWRRYVDEVAPLVPLATKDDLRWADAYAFGTPTRFGTPSAQLLEFIDAQGRLWQEGVFHDKPVTSFTSAINAHGGLESTILAMNNIFYHWGSLIIGPGYTDPVVYGAGGNPYGTGFATGMPAQAPGPAVLAAASYQGARLARITARTALTDPSRVLAGVTTS